MIDVVESLTLRDLFNKDLKGKIERTVEFVKKDFFAGGRFTSFTDPSYHNRRKESRKISRDSFVSYLGNLYSVPYRYAGMTARLQILLPQECTANCHRGQSEINTFCQ